MATAIANLTAKQDGSLGPAGLTGIRATPTASVSSIAKVQKMSDRYTIETVLKGNASDADYATVTTQLPLTLAPMAHRHNHYAPDYSVVNQAGATIGYGWSRTTKTTGQKYVAFHIDVAPDRRVSGNAGQSAKTGSGWIAELSSVQ